MEGVYQKLRNLDAYPKINEDFYSRTLSGGLITLISSTLMLFLFFSEFSLYLHAVTETTLLVDTTRGQTLRINFDIDFPSIRCSFLYFCYPQFAIEFILFIHFFLLPSFNL